MKQKEYLNELQTFADEVDNVYALYFNGDINADDFLNHVNLLNKELRLLKASYDSYLEEHPIALGTETYSSKRGYEAVSECFSVYEEVFDMTRETYEDKEALLYNYLAAYQKITDKLATYMASTIRVGSEEGVSSNG